MQAHVSLRDAQQELARVKGEKNTLSGYMKEESEKSRVLRNQLQQQVRQSLVRKDYIHPSMVCR